MIEIIGLMGAAIAALFIILGFKNNKIEKLARDNKVNKLIKDIKEEQDEFEGEVLIDEVERVEKVIDSNRGKSKRDRANLL